MFFAALLLWIGFFFHGVWIQPSHYHYVSFLYRICLLAGLVTLVLFYASGLYHSTLVQPRKFIPQANRGLRPFNVKLVQTSTGWLSMFRQREKRGEEKVKLVVSARAGASNVREGFEEYRSAYWQAIEEKATGSSKLADEKSKDKDRSLKSAPKDVRAKRTSIA